MSGGSVKGRDFNVNDNNKKLYIHCVFWITRPRRRLVYIYIYHRMTKKAILFFPFIRDLEIGILYDEKYQIIPCTVKTSQYAS